jgi:hypothetical protein
MSWFSVWLKKGFSISWTGWWGNDKNLNLPQTDSGIIDKSISDKQINAEINPNKEVKNGTVS